MNNSLERWRERTRKTRDGKREEKERQAHGTRTGTSGEAMHPDWNIRGAEALDWNVRGGNGPGLERPGPQKEEQMAAERSGEEHMNMSMDQVGKDTTDESREVGGEGAKGKAANHVTMWNPDDDNRGSSTPGLVHQGARRPWIGASGALGGRRSGGSKKRQGVHAQEAGTVEREDEKNKRREEGGEGEASTWNRDWNIRGSKAPGLEHPGGGGPGLERPGRQRPGIGTSGATKGGGYGSGEQRQGAHEQEQGPDEEGHDKRESGSRRRRSRGKSGQTRGTRTKTTGEAAHPDWNIRGRGSPELERPGLQEEEEAAAARNGKERKYKNQGRGRKRTRRARGGKREEKEKNERRMSTWNPDRNRLEGLG